MVALYNPLSNNDYNNINSVVAAANKFYKQSGLIFSTLVGMLVIFYPLAVKNEIANIEFIRTMIIVLSISGIVDYFVLGKYRMLLTADQKGYVISIAQIVGTVVMTVISIILMKLEFSSIVVKGIAAVIYILRCVAVTVYCKKSYKYLDLKVKPNIKAFDQRWAALVHQVSGLVVNNSAMVLLTLFVSSKALVEVSVYSVYNLVAYSLANLLSVFHSGLGAGFGQVISKGEKDVLHRSYSTYEYIYFLIAFVVYSCLAVLLYPFVSLYSMDFDDAALYARWDVVLLFALSGFLQSIKIPANTVISAAGHFKQTRSRAIAEACINVIVSVALVRTMGICGVLVGSCVSFLYRAVDMILYNNKYFVNGSLSTTLYRILRNLVLAVGLIYFGIRLIPSHTDNWIKWFFYALVYGITACIAYCGVNLIFEPKQFKEILYRLKEVLKRN